MPAYFYPATNSVDWEGLNSAAKAGVAVTAIMNPGSGPGTVTDSNYAAVVKKLHDAGGKVIGYVPSGYVGRQPNASSTCKTSGGRTTYIAQDIIDCAIRYKTLYTVDGIFVDEMGPPAGGVPAGEDLTFYQTIYNGIYASNPTWVIFGNPGVVPPETYLRTGSTGGADNLVIFENFATAFSTSSVSAWVYKYAPTRFGAILHDTPSNFDFSAALARAQANNESYFYAVDNGNYQHLPTSWSAQITAVLAFNKGK